MRREWMYLVLAATTLLAAPLPAAESDLLWPRWRGPGDSGCAPAGSGYPVQWDATHNVAWQVALPGKGSSTPIVCGGRIVVTAPVEDHDAVLAFDLAGKRLWQTVFGPQRPGKHRNGSGCNPSPITDGRQVFVYFKSGTLAAVDLDGKEQWKTNVQERFGKDTLFWDVGNSPALTERCVVVPMMHHGGSYLAAFDKRTGRLQWKADRNYETPLEGDHSYTTPQLICHAGKEALLVWGALHLTIHDAADGKVLWSCGGFNPDRKANWVAVASPLVVGDMAVVPFGRGNTLHGIRLRGSGDATAQARAWLRTDSGAFVPTPAASEGRVYLLRDRGEIECLDPATGKTFWSETLPKKASNYFASPLVADGKVYAAREDGMVYVVRADARHVRLAENDLGERLIASPVPLAGRLLLRGQEHLFCIGKK